MVVVKQNAMDITKSISTDLLHDVNSSPHQDRGNTAGLNALFGDGHVAYQSARSNPKAFDAVLWKDVGSDAINFRKLMNAWKP